MRKLSSAEFASLDLKRRNIFEGKALDLYREIGSLRVGESLLITNEEWPIKTKPSTGSVPKRFKPVGQESTFKIRLHNMKDESGFVVVRVA